MSLDNNDVGGCGICEAPVLDYEPGVSATKIDGVWYHPECARREGIVIAIDDAAQFAPKGIDLMVALKESLNREAIAIAEAADHNALEAADTPEEIAEDNRGWNAPQLPDDEGPTREKLDAEAEFDRKEMTRLLKFATKAIENAISTLRNEQYDRRVNATIADLCNALCELGDYPPDIDESPNTEELKKAYYGTLSGAAK